MTYSLENAYKENVVDTFYFFNHYLSYLLIPFFVFVSYYGLGFTYTTLRDTIHIDILGWLGFY